MKRTLFTTVLTLILMSTFNLSNTFAEDYTQLGLPEGAKARLGKGQVSGDIAYSPDGTRLAVASSIGVWIYDAQTGEELDLYTGHTDWVESVSFNADGTTLATGSRDDTVRLWNADTGTHLRTLSGHTDRINSVSFSPDGTTLATGSSDRTIRLWNADTGTHLRTLSGHTGSVLSVSFSPDGTTLATGSRQEIRLWNADTGTHLRTLSGHTDWVWSVSFSPDGTTLATGSLDRTIRLWNADTGTPLRTLSGYTNRVFSVSFSPDGTTLASGSDDGTVLLWELAPEPPQLPEDVNQDGIVNILDLVLIASNFGATGQNAADINGDGMVNIQDLVLVAAAFGNTATAPEIWSLNLDAMTTRAQVEQWLSEARQLNLIDPTFQRGITVLEQLLAALTPKETGLLANYPNPFNPETWIPYQLATPAEVTVRIYTAGGVMIRVLAIGHQPVGIYQDRHRAVYWDGRNETGESVASGVYFYSLTAGEFTATRKMVILK